MLKMESRKQWNGSKTTKIISLGRFTNLTTTKVIPSPRISDRVPFGTGKAIGDWIESEADSYATYDIRIWHILKSFVNVIPELQQKDLNELDFYSDSENQAFINFLNENEFNSGLAEIRKNSTDITSYLKRFFVWFNAFRVLKAVHHMRDNQYSNQPILNEAIKMAQLNGFYGSKLSLKGMLELYRTEEMKIK